MHCISENVMELLLDEVSSDVITRSKPSNPIAFLRYSKIL